MQVHEKSTGDDLLIVSDAGPEDFAYFSIPHFRRPQRVNVTKAKLHIVQHTGDLHKADNMVEKDPKSYLSELDGLIYALKTETKDWAPKKYVRKIFLQTDNTSVFWALSKQKATNPWQARQIKDVFSTAEEKNLKIIPRWRRRSEPLGKLADLGTRFQGITLKGSTKKTILKKFKLKKWPKKILDHFDILNTGQYGRRVPMQKIRSINRPNFIQIPWSFPTRNLTNFCEVLDMYKFKGIVELPYIRNRGVKMLTKKAKNSIIFSRSKKHYKTNIRSCSSLFLYF